MNILILGGGGREHALAWKIAQSPLCDTLVVAPGNAGIAAIARTEDLAIEDPAAVVAFCRHEKIDFVVVGPEAPLAAGVVDALIDAAIPCFGPTKAAAQLESSKSFTKTICGECRVPTAAWAAFDRADAAKIHIMASGAPIVVKADGLKAGKGVTVAKTVGQALAAVDAIFADPADPPPRVVLEEMMQGEEASFFALVDGELVRPLGTAQDYKRAQDGDEGPNTGGMGAFSPAVVMTPELERVTLETIMRPVVRRMIARGTPYRGVLYAGLMIETARDGIQTPRLVEFNARFGDPETQIILRRLESDLLPALLACSAPVGRLKRTPYTLRDVAIDWRDDRAVTVVMAAKGYPGKYQSGEAIGSLEAAGAVPGAEIFHAGTRAQHGETVSAGGRVLNFTATGDTFAKARDRAYAAVKTVEWPGGFYRTDIAAKAEAAEKAQAEEAAREVERRAAAAAAEEAANREAHERRAAEAQAELRARQAARDSATALTGAAASEASSPEEMSQQPEPEDGVNRQIEDAVVLDEATVDTSTSKADNAMNTSEDEPRPSGAQDGASSTPARPSGDDRA